MFSSNTSQVADDKLFVEDCFSTYLYQGNGSTQTITNGIDLAGKGGLVWVKSRNFTFNNGLIDTARGAANTLFSNATGAQLSLSAISAFTSSGFTVDATNTSLTNGNTSNFASWTFRKAPKFFDVVTYTGNGSTARAISHSLGVAPGSMFIKRTDSTGQWVVYHRSLGNANALVLESTSAQFSTNTFGYTTPDATTFTVGDYNNINGATYVAYLFAHDTTSDGIIQCGSFDQASSATPEEINLGWEPQWLLVKRSNSTSNWMIIDNMRGMVVDNGSGAGDMRLFPNLSNAESGDYIVDPTSTGFKFWGSTGDRWIYIAIRRGPMRTPTLGTTVFSPVSQTPSGVTTITTGFPVDMTWFANRSKASFSFTGDVDRLRGTTQTSTRILSTNATDAEGFVNTYGFGYDRMTSITDNYSNSNWGATTPVIYWNFRRAPSFFDEVCYTGTGVARTVNHNLGVAPEMIIVKSRTQAGTYWMVQHSALGPTKDIYLQLTNAASTRTAPWNDTAPTSTVFTVGTDSDTNGSGQNLVAYLFASCPGVSKCGTYTGNGSSQTINCGFAAGARFVMIKRTDSTGNWLVADSARGIVAGNDPLLYLNSTAAEVTTLDWIDADASGFIVNQDATANANVNGATYIYLAIS